MSHRVTTEGQGMPAKAAGAPKKFRRDVQAAVRILEASAVGSIDKSLDLP